KNFTKTRRRDSINFQVPILRLLAHQVIAHTPAHPQRAAGFVPHGTSNGQNLIRKTHSERIKAGNALNAKGVGCGERRVDKTASGKNRTAEHEYCYTPTR